MRDGQCVIYPQHRVTVEVSKVRATFPDYRGKMLLDDAWRDVTVWIDSTGRLKIQITGRERVTTPSSAQNAPPAPPASSAKNERLELCLATQDKVFEPYKGMGWAK